VLDAIGGILLMLMETRFLSQEKSINFNNIIQLPFLCAT